MRRLLKKIPICHVISSKNTANEPQLDREVRKMVPSPKCFTLFTLHVLQLLTNTCICFHRLCVPGVCACVCISLAVSLLLQQDDGGWCHGRVQKERATSRLKLTPTNTLKLKARPKPNAQEGELSVLHLPGSHIAAARVPLLARCR